MSRRRKSTDASRVTPRASPRDAARVTRHASPTDRALGVARAAGNHALERLLARDDTGRPIDAAAAAHHAALLGQPFDGVRVVDDTDAHDAAHALGAVAFTAGDRVYLGADAPEVESPAGEQLLAHELAHVVQQAAAGDARGADVSARGDAHEQAADAAAAGLGGAVTGGAPAAVQRQEKGDVTPGPLAFRTGAKPSATAITRDAARDILRAYFERVMQTQGGTRVSMTEDVRGMLRRIFLNDINGLMRMDVYLAKPVFPGDPNDLAAAVANVLPERIERARLAHLERGPSPAPKKTAVDRVSQLVDKTAPYVGPEDQEAQWRFDQQMKDNRRNDDATGPYGLDLERAFHIAQGLPNVVHPPRSIDKAQARVYPAVEAAIGELAADALIPAEARGTPQADGFADAGEVARVVARDLDVAQQRKQATVVVRLGANYQTVKDRSAIADAVTQLVMIVRAALPHHASNVQFVDVYFGDRIARHVSLVPTAE